jgi:tetratricopeptide (TPR) repeat protein
MARVDGGAISRAPAARLAGLGLVLLTLGVYAQTASFEFLTFDDDIYVTGIEGIRLGLSFEGIAWAWQHLAAGVLWQPLTMFSLLVDYELFGLTPGGYHTTNVLLHAAAVVLLFLWLRAATGAVWKSALVAALFAVHPLHVESVAWISSRKDVLSGVFAMGTIWAYVVYVQRGGWARKGGWVAYSVVTLLFTAGLLAKPILVTFPVLFLLLDLWPLERVSLASLRTRVALRRALEKLPWLAVSAAMSLAAIRDQRGGGAAQDLAVLNVTDRIANAVHGYVHYLGKTFWPFDLSPYYPHPSLPMTGGAPLSIGVVAASVLLLAVVTAAAWRARSRPYWLVGWLWFVGTLVPVIGLVQVGGQAYADRYTYLPLCGLFIALVWGASDALARVDLPGRRRLLFAVTASALVVVSCAGLAWRQAGYWHDSERLYRHALSIHPNNMLMRTNLGVALQDAGRSAEALVEFERALELAPNYPLLHFRSGLAHAQTGDLAAAEERLRYALVLTPDIVPVHASLADVLLMQGRADDAIAQYRQALARQPRNPALHAALGRALHTAGRLTEAEAANREALAIAPNHVPALYQLANVLGAAGRTDLALAELRRVLKLAPNHEGARARLAQANRAPAEAPN